MNISKKGINRLISRAIVEIVLVVIITIISFFAFTNENLQNTVQIAQAYSDADYAFQTMYAKTESTKTDILTIANLLDEVEISVRNPNKSEKKAKIFLEIEKSEITNLEDLEIRLDDKKIDLTKAILKDDKYRIHLDSKTISAYNTYKSNVQFIGSPYIMGNIKYSFDIS